MNFEQALIAKVREVRAALAEVESISQMSLLINITGRVHDGELSLNYSLGSSYSEGGQVIGNDIDSIVEEYKHRFGWDKQNKVKMISFSVPQQPKPDMNDEIPF